MTIDFGCAVAISTCGDNGTMSRWAVYGLLYLGMMFGAGWLLPGWSKNGKRIPNDRGCETIKQWDKSDTAEYFSGAILVCALLAGAGYLLLLLAFAAATHLRITAIPVGFIAAIIAAAHMGIRAKKVHTVIREKQFKLPSFKGLSAGKAQPIEQLEKDPLYQSAFSDVEFMLKERNEP